MAILSGVVVWFLYVVVSPHAGVDATVVRPTSVAIWATAQPATLAFTGRCGGFRRRRLVRLRSSRWLWLWLRSWFWNGRCSWRMLNHSDV